MGFADRRYSRSNPSFMDDWTAVLTILVANIALWVANLVGANDFPVSQFLVLQGDLGNHLLKAWELVTYGFVHSPSSPSHLLFNMLALWFFGQEVEARLGRAEFFRFYLTAIVMAGIAWLVSVQVGHPLQASRYFLMGASGAVMAVMAVFIWHNPRREIYIWGVLPVPAWGLGLLYFLMDVNGATNGGGNVANVAHLGGAAFGLCYAWRGWDLGGFSDLGARLNALRKSWGGAPAVRVFRPDDTPVSNRRPPQDATAAPRRQNADDVALQEAVDQILEKISRSGEASLTPAERDTLTAASRRLKERMGSRDR